jgi:arylsulfatase A-like enzyme
VPLVMRYPAQIPPDTVVGTSAEGIDLMPTLLAAAGIPRDNWPATYGRDLAPSWRGEYEALDSIMIAEHFQPSMLPDNAPETMGGDLGELFVRRRALLSDDHKYVVSSSGDEQLFHLSSDPAEQHDLSDGYQQQRAERRFLLEQWAEAFGVTWGEQTQVDKPELDPATEQRLRELGYLE